MHDSTIKTYFSRLLTFSAFLIFTFSGIPLYAQITIEEDIFTKFIGKKYKEVLYETNLDIDDQLAEIKAAVGPDQIWDFSNLNYIDSTISIYEVMVIDPNDPLLENEELAGSQYINKVTLLPGYGGVQDTMTSYLYTSLEDGKWITNGSFTLIDLDLDGTPDSTIQFFTPPFLEVQFPVTSTSEWFDSTALTTIFDGMEFIGSFMIDSTWVRGYGTLITPNGSAQALRVHNKKLTKNPFLPIIEESNDYDFVTAEDMILASIVVEDGRAFHSVKSMIDGGPSSTFDYEKLEFNISQVSPNPFHDFIDVNINMLKGGEVECRIISMDGSRSPLLSKERLPSGKHSIQISTSDIPVGMYFLEVRSGRFIQHVNISKI